MENNNISDYERALELKQRQLNDIEKNFSIKLQRGWQKLKENSAQKKHYLHNTERSFKELRQSPVFERQFDSVELKLSELNDEHKIKQQELLVVGAKVEKLRHQGKRISELLKIARNIKINRFESNINEELITFTGTKNKLYDSDKNEIELKDKEDSLRCDMPEAIIEDSPNTLIESDYVSISAFNFRTDCCSMTKRQEYSRSNTKKPEKKNELTNLSTKEVSIKECKVTVQGPHGGSYDINLNHSAVNGLQAEIVADNTSRLKKISAERIGLIRKLKNCGYADVLLHFGIN